MSLQVDILPLVDESHQVAPSHPRAGATIDLNRNGLLCCNVGYLPVGGVVQLFLRLPDVPEQPISCYARVVRCDTNFTPSYGLRFIGLAPWEVRRIQDFIGRHARPLLAGRALSWNYRFRS